MTDTPAGTISKTLDRQQMPSKLTKSALPVQEYEEEKPAKHNRGSRKDDLAHAAAQPLPEDPADEKDANDEQEEADERAKAAPRRRKAGHAAQKGGSSDTHAPSHDATHPVRKVLLLPCMRTHGAHPYFPAHMRLMLLCYIDKAAKSITCAASLQPGCQ